MTPTLTATAEAANANIHDLGLTVVTEGNIILFEGLNPRLGDLYKQILLPTGALVFMPLRSVSAAEIRDRVNADPALAESSTITLAVRQH